MESQGQGGVGEKLVDENEDKGGLGDFGIFVFVSIDELCIFQIYVVFELWWLVIDQGERGRDK
jgi:hypothetical protein